MKCIPNATPWFLMRAPILVVVLVVRTGEDLEKDMALTGHFSTPFAAPIALCSYESASTFCDYFERYVSRLVVDEVVRKEIPVSTNPSIALTDLPVNHLPATTPNPAAMVKHRRIMTRTQRREEAETNASISAERDSKYVQA